jgi:hypothetical protein
MPYCAAFCNPTYLKSWNLLPPHLDWQSRGTGSNPVSSTNPHAYSRRVRSPEIAPQAPTTPFPVPANGIHPFPSLFFSLQQHNVEKSKTKQRDAEQTVDCEKGGIEPLQTVAAKQQVLIHQEARGKEDAGQIETT